ICISLEISDILLYRTLSCKTPLSVLDLLLYGKLRAGGKFSGPALAAEDTATGTKRAIPVRAGTSSVQRQLIQFFSKSFPEVIVQGTEAAVSQKRILLCDVCHFQRQL